MYDLTKWVKPLFSNFFFFSAFNRLGLIYLYYGFCDDRNISAISQIFYRNRNNPFSFTHDENIQLFALQCWYKIQKSDDENSLINQHEGVILIWHQILSNTLQKFIADGGETYESHLSSQRVNAMKYSSKSEFEPNYDLFKQLLSWSFCQIFSLSKFCGTKSNIK